MIFYNMSFGQQKFAKQGELLRCPCVKCKCKVFKYVDQVRWDFYEEGFVPNYYWWTNHQNLIRTNDFSINHNHAIEKNFTCDFKA